MMMYANATECSLEMVLLEMELEDEYNEAALDGEREVAFSKIHKDYFKFEEELARQQIRDQW